MASIHLRPSLFALIAIAAAGLQHGVSADEVTSSNEWSRFRGANGIASVANCSVPIPWNGDDLTWEVDLPGKGNASPIVRGDKVFIVSADPNTAERYLLAYDLATGNELWRKAFDSKPYHLHARSTYASSTPCASDALLFVTWATPEEVILKAFDHDGGEVWSRDLGPFVSQHGYGASPALFDDKLVLFNSQQAEELPKGAAPGTSSVQCFDAATGKTIWETPRTATRACYGVPVRFTDASGKDAILLSNTGDGLFALELETGTPLWNRNVFHKRSVSSPVIVGDIGFCSEGSGGGGNVLFAISLKGDHELLFEIDRSAPYVPSPVAKGNLLFLWSDNGIVTCVKLPENEVAWSKRIGGNVSTSPVVAGDKLVGIAEDGTLTALAASTEFAELGSIKLDDTIRATPLVSEHYILVRTDSKLLCIGKPSAAK